MSGHYALLRMLREQGHRLTPQREMVILTLHEANSHLTAEDIHRRVCAQNPCVDISTVYRTLELLREMGIVSQFQGDDHQALFELAVRAPHHHLVCRHCHATLDIGGEEMEVLRAQLAARHHFEVDLSHLVLEGLCQACAKQGSNETAAT